MKTQSLLSKLVILAGGLSVLPTITNAQIVYMLMPKWMTRYELSYGMPMAWAKYKRMDSYPNPENSAQTISSTYKENVRSKFSFNESFNYYFPLKQLGDNKMLTLSVGMDMNMYSWDYQTASYGGDDSYTYSGFFNSMTYTMAMPIGADIRWGGEGFTDKSRKLNFVLGAGVYPNISFTSDNTSDGIGYGVNPYLKAEFGVFFGISMKIRAMATVGNIPFMKANTSLTGVSNNTSLTGKQTVSLSLVLLPFSWAWGERGWWNTPNQNEW